MRFETEKTVPFGDVEMVLHALEECLQRISDDVERKDNEITVLGVGPSPRSRNRRDTAVLRVEPADGGSVIRADVTFQASALLGASAQDEVVKAKLEGVYELMAEELKLAGLRAEARRVPGAASVQMGAAVRDESGGVVVLEPAEGMSEIAVAAPESAGAEEATVSEEPAETGSGDEEMPAQEEVAAADLPRVETDADSVLGVAAGLADSDTKESEAEAKKEEGEIAVAPAVSVVPAERLAEEKEVLLKAKAPAEEKKPPRPVVQEEYEEPTLVHSGAPLMAGGRAVLESLSSPYQGRTPFTDAALLADDEEENRSGWKVAVLALLLVVAVAGGGALWMRSGHESGLSAKIRAMLHGSAGAPEQQKTDASATDDNGDTGGSAADATQKAADKTAAPGASTPDGGSNSAPGASVSGTAGGTVNNGSANGTAPVAAPGSNNVPGAGSQGNAGSAASTPSGGSADANSLSSSVEPPAVADPKAFLQSWVGAMRSRDPRVQASYYADPTYRYMGQVWVSRSEIARQKGAAIAERKGIWTVRLDDVQVQQNGNQATVHLVKHFIESPEPPSEVSEHLVRTRLEMQQIDGRWEITSEQDISSPSPPPPVHPVPIQ